MISLREIAISLREIDGDKGGTWLARSLARSLALARSHARSLARSRSHARTLDDFGVVSTVSASFSTVSEGGRKDGREGGHEREGGRLASLALARSLALAKDGM